jgi:hypothetical protein
MGFANNASTSSYDQQYGIQGDRPKTMFFEAPRMKGKALNKAYENLKETDEYLYNNFKKQSEERFGKDTPKYNEALENYRDIYNNSTLNYMKEDGTIETPIQSAKRDKQINLKVAKLKRALRTAGLTQRVIESEIEGEEPFIKPSIIGADHVGEGKLYQTEEELLKDFILNESINRTHLNNLFQGPISHRKSIEDHIKRATGTNSTGNRVDIDKPVVTVVIRAKSKTVNDAKNEPVETSDSFSINGERLHKHIASQIGGMDRLGANMKDLLFQIDPYSGDMTYLKMSSFGIIGNKDSNNFMKMAAPKYAEGRVGYKELADVAFALEELVGNDKYIKIIDENAIKGNDGKQVTPIDIDELIGVAGDKNKLQEIINKNSFEREYTGYRTPFKLSKDLTKVPLKEQVVVGSGQLMKLSLNTGHPKDVIAFEKKIVDLLKRQLGIEKGQSYSDSKLYNILMDTGSVINGVLKSTEETGKVSISTILGAVKAHNDAIEDGARTYRQKLKSLLENNKNVEERSEEVVKEMEDLRSKIQTATQGKITALDHPNLKAQIEQYIGSRMGKQGARPEMAGAYLHMIPDYGNTLPSPKYKEEPIKNKVKFKKKVQKNEQKLKRLKKENQSPELIKKQEEYLNKLKSEQKKGTRTVLTDLQVAVPWSMFGATREQAEEFIERRKQEGVPVKVAVVRVPASIGVSTFGADIAYLTDGEANTVITPDEFIKMSDADHDGDKAFVYREELDTKTEKLKNEQGEEYERTFTKEVKGPKSSLFWAVYTQVTSDEIREQHSEDLTVDNIKEIVKDIKKQKGESTKKQSYSLQTYDDLADVLSKYSFGAKAIGIEAVAGKMLSMFTQSGIKLNKGYAIEFDGKVYDRFVSDNAMNVAKMLQAALDLGNDPILLETGINKHTIGAANVMLNLGVPLRKVIETLKSDAIQTLVKEIDKNSSVYSGYEGTFEEALFGARIDLANSETVNASEKALNSAKGSVIRLESIINKGKKGNEVITLKAGKNYQTKFTKDNEGNLIAPVTFTVELDENKSGKDKRVIKIKPPEILNEKDKEDFALMESFVKFNEISSEINSILPVIQRDNSMPNNSQDLRKTAKAFAKLRKGERIDFTPLLERPLIQHYEEVVTAMTKIYEEHFTTEKGSYSQPAYNDINRIDKAIQSYGRKKVDKRNKVVDVYQRMIAQGDLQVASPKKLVENLPSQVESLLAYQKSGEYISNVNESLDPHIENIITKYNNGFSEETAEYKEAVEQLTNSLDTQKEIDEALDLIEKAKAQVAKYDDPAYFNNMFLQNIVVKESKTGAGVKTIVPVDNYRKLDFDVKEEIRKDFEKIMYTDLGNSILKYQLLRNGVSDKIGSLIDLMPTEISVNFLKKMSLMKDNERDQPSFKNAHFYNALLALKDEIPLAITINGAYINSGWLKTGSDQIIKVPKKQGNELVYVNTTYVPAIRSEKFVQSTDYNFTKFDPNATTKEVVPNEVMEIKKKC